MEKAARKKTKKDEKEKGKAHDHLAKLPKQTVSSQFNRDENIYHFGLVSVDYNGSGRKNCELHIIADGARLRTYDFVAKEGRDFTISSQWLMAKDAKVVVTTKNRREAIFNINVPTATTGASRV